MRANVYNLLTIRGYTAYRTRGSQGLLSVIPSTLTAGFSAAGKKEHSMILTNQAVRHKVFGRGRISDLDDAVLVVTFACGEKRFVFPDAFSQFLKFEDEEKQAEVAEMLEEKQQERDVRAKTVLEQAHRTRDTHKAQDDELLDVALEAAYAQEEPEDIEYSAIFDLSPFQLHSGKR